MDSLGDQAGTDSVFSRRDNRGGDLLGNIFRDSPPLEKALDRFDNLFTILDGAGGRLGQQGSFLVTTGTGRSGSLW